MLCMWAICLHAQSGEFDPANPGDPMPYYILTVNVSPSSGGTANITRTMVTEGQEITLSISTAKDFKFSQWVCGDSLLGTSTYLYFTMPARNVVITAQMTYEPEAFNPPSPEDPQGQGEIVHQHHVTVYTSPSVGGSVNRSSFNLTEGAQERIYAYPNAGYEFIGWFVGDNMESTSNPVTLIMRESDMAITAHFRFNPASPEDPGANLYDPATGTLIIDRFTPGYLSNVVYNLVGNGSYDNIQSVTIKGEMTSDDYGVLSYFYNAEILDLSQTIGYSAIPSWAFNGMSQLVRLLLPASVETMGSNAFYGCSALSEIVIYAPAPPVLESYAYNPFESLDEGLVIRVPASSVSLYQASDLWGNFVILPMDVQSLNVTLPEDKLAQYENMYLELLDTKSGQLRRYVITNRNTYSFTNVFEGTSYQLDLRNSQGRSLGQEMVAFAGNDTTITFSHLLLPIDISLKVLNTEGEEVTDNLFVDWYDNEGKYLQRGKSIAKQIENDVLRYRILLSQSLLEEYQEPAEQSVVVSTEEQETQFSLTKHAIMPLAGVILDSASHAPVSSAKVAVKQTIKGQTQKLWTAGTDNSGSFTLKILNIPATEITVSASNYVTKALPLEQWQVDSTIYLKKFVGTNLNIELQYSPAVQDGTSSAPQNWYGDYTDFQFSIHNNTQNKRIDSYQFSFPQLQIKEAVSPSDELAITVKSVSGVFAPYETTVVIDENNRAILPIILVERGGIKSSYNKSVAQEVMAMLYDESSKRIGYQTYNDKSANWNRLVAGNYSLVNIKSDNKLRNMANLSDLESNGLHAGEDYILSAITVTDGNIAMVEIDSIPDYSELMDYMGNNASFSANKSSLVVGDYLTLRAQLDFQSQYVNAVSDVAIVVELPQSVEFIENAILVGGKAGSYSLNEKELTIPMSKLSDLVKFCVIPTDEGTYTVNAYAQFTYQGKTCRQPLGLTNIAVDNASIAAMLKYSTNQVITSGLTTPNSDIELYDNDELIAISKAKPNGTWQIEADLEYAYNLSKHHIYASITTPDGLKMRTKTKNLLYNISSNPYLQRIEMKVFEQGQLHADVTWDYENNVMTPTFYQYTAAQASFEFYADFVQGQNETIKQVNLILYMHEGKHILPLKYRVDIDKWFGTIGTGMLGEAGNGIINVGAEVYMQSTEYHLDAELMSALYAELRNHISAYEISHTEQLFMDLEEALNNDNDENVDSILVALFGSNIIPSDSLQQNYDTNDYDSLVDQVNAITDSINILSMHNDTIPDWESITRIEDCVGIDSLSLSQQGYILIPKTNGRFVMMLSDENLISIVDFEENIHITMQTGIILPSPIRSYIETMKQSRSCTLPTKFKPIDDGLNEINEQIKAITEAWDKIINKLQQMAEMNKKLQDDLAKAIANTPRTQKLQRTKLIQAMAKAGKNAEKFEQWAKNVSLEFNDKFKNSKFGKVIGKLTAKINIFTTLVDTYDFLSEEAKLVHQLNDLYLAVPTPECERELERADALANRVCSAGIDIAFHTIEGLGYLSTQMSTLIIEVAGAAETCGASLLLSVINMGAGLIFDARKESNMNKDQATLERYQKEVANFKWNCDEDPEPDPDPDPNPNPAPNDLSPIEIDPIFPDLQAHIDPSGFVYEAVEDNRIEGVKATVYYKDTHENLFGEMVEEDVMWNAWDYDQENPQYTDAEGKYQWFVPQGLWQVRFEKEGYEPTQSEWLPVPPPQLEVNIPIVQLRQPEVTNAIAHKDAIDINFDKFMMPSLLNLDNIFVTANDQVIPGTITLLDEQRPYNDNTTSYASKVRFVPTTPFTASEITLTVSTRVHSYADVPLAQTFQQTFDVENAEEMMQAQAPIPSIPSGTIISNGTELTLSSNTENATIRYTMDGTDPDCLSGLIYSGQPLFLFANETIEIRAIACADGYTPSNVVHWIYIIGQHEAALEEIIDPQPKVTKLFLNGQILILRGDKIYTIQGQLVK